MDNQARFPNLKCNINFFKNRKNSFLRKNSDNSFQRKNKNSPSHRTTSVIDHLLKEKKMKH